jgi:DNA mismatch repair protein MutL
MNVIRILPEIVASQIAAGEVVDRPASVVRELMDNSIDAGADRIAVTIESGGKRRIRVSDNGIGMSRDDLLLCVERHATSKIKTASDLSSVRTLGFRGEALPSIAAVSRMQMTSLPHGQLSGHRLRISGGKLLEIEETGAPPGTTVEVRDLFFNIPARRKFLRTVRTETDAIVDLLSRMAMPFPNISFRLDDGTRNVMNLPASGDTRERLSGLFGRKTAKAMMAGEENQGDLSVRVYVGPPDLDRNRGDRLYVFVNNRHVRDRLATKAIMEGYGRRLMKGQYPQVLVFIEIDPLEIDVNVHPTKQEIRFHNASRVFQAIVAAVGKRLEGAPQPFSRHGLLDQRPAYAPWGASTPVSEPPWEYAPGPGAGEAPSPPAQTGAVPDSSIISAGPRIIGQLANTYILCETANGLMIVDQHAAHERIVYEHLKKSLTAERIEMQTLLIPHELELSTRETRVILEKGEELRRFGLELDPFGGNTFLLTAVPALLKNVDWQSFVSELVTRLAEEAPDEDAAFDACIMLMACHGAIRAGQELNHDEMERLLTELGGMDLPTNCPHGRPVFREITSPEMERMFKWVV